MLCIKGFADPLCYLLSLLSPEPVQLLGRLNCLPGKALLRVRHLSLGSAWKPGASESLLAPSLGHAHADKNPAGAETWGHHATHCRLQGEIPVRSSPHPWVSPLVFTWSQPVPGETAFTRSSPPRLSPCFLLAPSVSAPSQVLCPSPTSQRSPCLAIPCRILDPNPFASLAKAALF